MKNNSFMEEINRKPKTDKALVHAIVSGVAVSVLGLITIQSAFAIVIGIGIGFLVYDETKKRG